MLPGLRFIEKKVDNLRKNSGIRISEWAVFTLALAILLIGFLFMPKVVSLALSMALFLAPLWLPLLIVYSAWALWVIWRQSDFIAEQKYVLLEIRPPRTIAKTPLAMEAVLSGFHHSPGEGTWYKKFIQGSVRPYFSLEIVSIEGKVHFFIWTRANFRRLIEAHIYAQYPETQVVEVPDYTRLISGSPDEFGIWGCEFAHTKEDPYPIKSYVDYGLDKVAKEHEQVDPLSNLVEFMASMRKGEYLWLQFIIRVHKGEKYAKGVEVEDPKTKEKKMIYPKDWKEHAKVIVDNIRKATREPYKDPVTGTEIPGFPNPTKGQLESMAAIDRNIAKLPFDVGMRGIYLAREGSFDPINITGLTGIFKQFNSEGWNGFKPTGGFTYFDDYPWEVGVSKLKRAFAEDIIDAYRRRTYFHEPQKGDDSMVLSTEELATIYHVPSAAVVSPTLPRVQSATGEAPANLPT